MVPQPTLAGLHVVFARCAESSRAPSALSAAGVPWTVVQKGGVRCNSSRAAARAARSGLGDAQRHHVKWLAHNRGDECAAYLEWIVDRYDDLPELTAFVQFGAERQLIGSELPTSLRMVVGRARELGYTALSRHSFQGAWPAPCEPAAKQRVFANCSAALWRRLEPTRPTAPRALRFYANGLFVASRARIRSRPRALYAELAERLAGRQPSLCDVPDTRAHPPAQRSRLVGDCHLLEKTWHILLGEPAVMPAAQKYDRARAPHTPGGLPAPRIGGRFVGDAGKCRQADAAADAALEALASLSS